MYEKKQHLVNKLCYIRIHTINNNNQYYILLFIKREILFINLTFWCFFRLRFSIIIFFWNIFLFVVLNTRNISPWIDIPVNYCFLRWRFVLQFFILWVELASEFWWGQNLQYFPYRKKSSSYFPLITRFGLFGSPSKNGA